METQVRRFGGVRTRVVFLVALAGVSLGVAGPAGAGVPGPSSTITNPEHRGFYAHVESFDATASGGLVDGLQVWLKMKMSNGRCQSFNGESFVARRCSRARWLDAEPDGAEWSYELPESFLLRPSDPSSNIKRYIVRTRAHDTNDGYETAFEVGRNIVRFDIYGGP